MWSPFQNLLHGETFTTDSGHHFSLMGLGRSSLSCTRRLGQSVLQPSKFLDFSTVTPKVVTSPVPPSPLSPFTALDLNLDPGLVSPGKSGTTPKTLKRIHCTLRQRPKTHTVKVPTFNSETWPTPPIRVQVKMYLQNHNFEGLTQSHDTE